ncbi:MAG: group II intron reverse transcriptase domain-containing protein [Burkholderiaceae bacterium]|nr:group II intron reverse transcriptase domain-containing protein [Burkholderiaceae bacterium]
MAHEQGLFSLENIYRQYLACRKNKRNTANALRFEARQELNLLALRDALVDRSYVPGRSVCFFVKRPKLREVFAADFRDRVVHHVLVSHLEKIWEPIFIHDSYACRKGKGVHAGVERLQLFMRQATANGTRPAWYLQLDIRNYFMSIAKRRLFDMVAAKLKPSDAADAEARWLTERLVFHDCTVDPVLKGDPRLIDRLPPHKTLFRAPPGKGLPIGNLNSQFFANVYLNALDQFVKHELKCRWYLRYCDDFVLLAESPEQLAAWQVRIAGFLAERLDLQLNPSRERLRPVADGVDFLGYIVRPFHLLVRKRVLGHLHEALQRSERALVTQHAQCVEYRFDDELLGQLQASLASYLGHLRRAACARLVASIWARHAWLSAYLKLNPSSLQLSRRDRAALQARTVLAQYRHWVEAFPGEVVLIQVGAFVERLEWPPRRLRAASRPGEAGAVQGERPGLKRMRPTRRGAVEGFPLPQLRRRVVAWLAEGKPVVFIGQKGEAGGGVMQRGPVLRWAGVADF